MENRKNPNADLESKKGIFFQIGLVIVLGAVFLAFEWKTYSFESIELQGNVIAEVNEELIPITWSPSEPPPPPPPPASEPEILKLVDDIENKREAMETVPIVKTKTIEVIEQPEEKIDEYIPYGSNAQMPVFPGCELMEEEFRRNCTYKKIQKFIASKIRYPEELKRSRIEGKLYLEFVIDKNGDVNNIKLLRGIDGGERLTEESIKAVKKLPQFQPAVQQGRAVGVVYRLPVKFELN